MMMTNKEKYKQAFSVLHATNNISLEVNKDMNRKKVFNCKKLAAACVCLALTLCAGLTVYAAKNHLWRYSQTIGDRELFSKELETVSCKELTEEDLSQKYISISDLEEKMGIDLLESSLAYEYTFPYIKISKMEPLDSLIYTISTSGYYVKDEVLTEQDVWMKVGDKPFSVSYQAEFIVKLGKVKGMEGHYDAAEFIESYTTENGLQAEIFRFGNALYGDYGAYIEKDNIKYRFETFSIDNVDVQDFKYFLDSLK